jgi:hypothetical protein
MPQVINNCPQCGNNFWSSPGAKARCQCGWVKDDMASAEGTILLLALIATILMLCLFAFAALLALLLNPLTWIVGLTGVWFLDKRGDLAGESKAVRYGAAFLGSVFAMGAIYSLGFALFGGRFIVFLRELVFLVAPALLIGFLVGKVTPRLEGKIWPYLAANLAMQTLGRWIMSWFVGEF